MKVGCTFCDCTHTDDSLTERTVYAALRELGVCSPFAEVGLGKADILSMADALGVQRILPSYCFATRIPFGTGITLLEKIASVKTMLRGHGILGILLVRLIGDEVVVEVEAWEMQKALGLLSRMKDLGFSRVRVAGYAAVGVERWRQKEQ